MLLNQCSLFLNGGKFNFRSYNELPIIVAGMDKECERIFTKIHQFLSSFKGSFTSVIDVLSQNLESSLFAKPTKKQEKMFQSEIMKNFSKLTIDPVINLKSFQNVDKHSKISSRNMLLINIMNITKSTLN
jgi:hypothetical protein